MHLHQLKRWLAMIVIVSCFVRSSSTHLMALKRPMPQVTHTITIYVDEGAAALVGHVFVELSDGHNRLFRGFYPEEAITDAFGKETALFRVAGGEVRDDKTHDWNVKRTYNITKEGFERALRGIDQIREQGTSWWLSQNCADFAEGVATTAGVPLHIAGLHRPHVFGEYFRSHGGVLNRARDCSDEAEMVRLAEKGLEGSRAGLAWSVQAQSAEGVKNWQKAIEGDLERLNNERLQLQRCLVDHAQK